MLPFLLYDEFFWFSSLISNNRDLIIRVFYKILIILILFIIYIYFTATVAYAECVDDLQDGTIPRTPLLQQGQSIKTLPHGIYNVTGGTVQIGYLGNGSVTKVIGISANGNPSPLFNYTPNNQPYNTNFASILYELREAGQKTISHSALDYAFANRQQVTPVGNLNAYFLQTFRTSAGMGVSQYGESTISNKLINSIAS